jgi:hypothetical protein
MSAVVVALTATAVTIGHDVLAAPQDQAMAALADRAGSDCQRVQFISLAYAAVDQKVAESEGNAGWIVPDRVFVGGDPEAAAAAKNGIIVAQDESQAWILTDEGGEGRLLGMHPRSVGNKQAFVVTQIVDPC